VLHARGAGECAGDGDEELRQDAAGLRLLDRSPHRRAVRRGGAGDPTAWNRDCNGGRYVNVSCPECRSMFRVDPAKVPAAGVRARCSGCGGVITIGAGSSIEEEFASGRPKAAAVAPAAVAAMPVAAAPVAPPPPAPRPTPAAPAPPPAPRPTPVAPPPPMP